MGLSLVVGPAHAGKVALLLDRFVERLDRDPWLLVPNRGDVDRVERELAGRLGALLAGRVGTFDSLFEHLARGGDGGRRLVGDAERALLVRRAISAVPELEASARFPGFGDALSAVISELEANLARDDALEPRTGGPALRLPLGAGRGGRMGSGCAAEARTRSADGRARVMERRARPRLRLRGPDRRRVEPARGARCARRGSRLPPVRACETRVRVVAAHGHRPVDARGSGHRRAARGRRSLSAPGARTPRATPVRRRAGGHRARRLDRVPRGSRAARHAGARRRAGARSRRRGRRTTGDRGRLPIARQAACAPRDGVRLARRPVRDRGQVAARVDTVRTGAAGADALCVVGGWQARPVPFPPLALRRARPP